MSQEQIEERVRAYRESLILKASQPQPSPEERRQAAAERLLNQLEKTQVMLGKVDERRINLLIKAAGHFARAEDFASVFGVAAEIMSMCRTTVLGYRETHPVSSYPPPRLPSDAGASRPPPRRDDPDEEDD